MSAELDRTLSQLFHEVTVLAEEEMRAYRRVSASTVRTLISAASGLVAELEEGFKMSGHSANLANICREEWKTTAIEYHNEVVALKARVAELEGDLKLIDVALMAKKALQDGFVDIPAEIDSAEKFIEWINKESGNEG